MEQDIINFYTQYLGALDTRGLNFVQAFLTLVSESSHFREWLPQLYNDCDANLAIKFIVDALKTKELIPNHDLNL